MKPALVSALPERFLPSTPRQYVAIRCDGKSDGQEADDWGPAVP
jgi:hypothetical protein